MKIPVFGKILSLSLLVAAGTSLTRADVLTWDPLLNGGGGGGGTWNLNGTANWFNGATDVKWLDNSARGTNGAVFGGTAGTVTLNSSLSASNLLFQAPDGPLAVDARATVLALGGASWPRLGSTGAWAETLAARGVTISPLRPTNCGFTVAWSNIFRDRFEGHPLKGVALSFGARSVRGEALITRTGIEGGAVYALSADLREVITELTL